MTKLNWKTCTKVGVSLFLLFLAIHYWESVASALGALLGAAVPLIIGGAIAYLINILMVSYEKIYFPKSKKKFCIKSRRPVCLTAAFLTLVAIITLIFWLILPQLISCIKLLIDLLPDFIENAISRLKEWKLLSPEILTSLSNIDWQSRIGEIANALISGIGSVTDVVFNAVLSVFSGIVTAVIAIIFALYLLASKEKLAKQFHRLTRRYCKPDWNEKLYYVLGVVNNSFKGYITGQCTEAVILGVLCFIGMLILQLPYAPMISALIAFTALIPVAGAYIGAGISAFMIAMVSPVKALIFLLFILILQQLEGNLIFPRVVGSSLGLPAIWVLAAVTIGGGVMGVMGMLLGVPLASSIYHLVRNDVKNSESNLPPEERIFFDPPLETVPVSDPAPPAKQKSKKKKSR
ncbi:MAG: AI-2E family transporter [Oscillospiraceae bacterium]|nr:AI-2E family transporter [Oscillospiraceae bacterium]